MLASAPNALDGSSPLGESASVDITEGVGQGRNPIQRGSTELIDRQGVSTLLAGLAHDLSHVVQLLRLVAHRIDTAPSDVRGSNDLFGQALIGSGLAQRILQEISAGLGEKFAQPEDDLDVLETCATVLAFTDTARPATVTPSLEARNRPRVSMPRVALERALLNLVLNAIHAVGDTGNVRIVIEACNGIARILVEDDGPGVPLSLHESISGPFLTTSGTAERGLGLTVARAMAQTAGGRLLLESAKNPTRFVLELPIGRR